MSKLALKEMIKQELMKYPIHKLFHEKLADDLVELFKQWALELLPETINEKFLDTPKERGYILGWNRCLTEIRKRIEEE